LKLVKTIAVGAAVFAFATGSALAGELYGIDENRDGVIDSYLLLEESDTLA
jgi:hypothetical protein